MEGGFGDFLTLDFTSSTARVHVTELILPGNMGNPAPLIADSTALNITSPLFFGSGRSSSPVSMLDSREASSVG
jgi:hypothetical protein